MTIAEKIVKLDEDANKLIDLNNQLEQALYGTDVGGKSYYDEFWDMVQKNGNRTDYAKAFLQWNCEQIRPKYKVIPIDQTSAQNTFAHNDMLKKIEAKYFDFSQKTRGAYLSAGWYWTFSGCHLLEEIEDIGMMPDYEYNYTFAYCDKLKKIAKITVDEATTYSQVFLGCRALEHITFEGVIGNSISFDYCTKLTKDSITNIINHLSDTVSGKTLTLSRTATDNAFPCMWENENGELINVGCGGNGEWVELRETKPNWTITLV